MGRLTAHCPETAGRLPWAVEARETGETLGELALEHADFDNETLSYRVSLFNERASRSYEKLGFVNEGITRDSLFYDGKRYDATIMSLLAPEWRSGTSTAPAVN
ncbi:MAG TPA: GNAT family protein [Mycobacteriales bacterium]|nr:GNAT family protein [Mycobacteriales bacterium]